MIEWETALDSHYAHAPTWRLPFGTGVYGDAIDAEHEDYMTLTLEEDIVQWAASRPAWQQAILHKLTEGREPSQTETDAVADDLIAAKITQVAPLTASDMPGTQATGATISHGNPESEECSIGCLTTKR